MGKWIELYLCECGAKYFPSWGDLFFCDNICRNCGKSKYEYTFKIGRKIDDSKWLKPSTWNSSHWEYKK